MKRYIINGTPGAGKTAILLELEARGYAVVPEAATDVIARRQARGEPWDGPSFVDDIVALQRRRQDAPVPPGVTVQVFDRSPVCTLALAWYARQPVSDALAGEVDRTVRAGVYERPVFFVRPIGFVTATAARRITYEQSLEFERVHEDAYRSGGFSMVDVPAGTVAERAVAIDRLIRSLGRAHGESDPGAAVATRTGASRPGRHDTDTPDQLGLGYRWLSHLPQTRCHSDGVADGGA